MSNFQGVLGLLVIFAVAVLASNNRRRISPRTVLVALALQVLFAFAVLRWSVGRDVLDFVSGQVAALVSYAGRRLRVPLRAAAQERGAPSSPSRYCRSSSSSAR